MNSPRAFARFVHFALLTLASFATAVAQSSLTAYEFSTFAGARAQGSTDGTGTAARFSNPMGLAVDSGGNIYVADSANNTIRKVTSSGVVTTLAGSAGQSGSADGTGSSARFYMPNGVAVDGVGNVYVADSHNHTIRKVTPGGVVTTVAGSAGPYGDLDGTGSTARFAFPNGVALDGAGNVYVADSSNHKIRKVTPVGSVTTLAGHGYYGDSSEGIGSAAGFNEPSGLIVNSTGVIYVADRYNNLIRKVTPAGQVTTLAGTRGQEASGVDGTGFAARFNEPYAVALDSAGNILVADKNNSTIRRVTPAGVVTTIGGTAGQSGTDDGLGSAARFTGPCGVAVDGADTIYVASPFTNTIRKGVPKYLAITGFTPASIRAGATVTITGTGFTTVTDVTFNGVGAAFAINSNTEISATAPAGVTTGVIGVAWNGAALSSSTYTVETPPMITGHPEDLTVRVGATASFAATVAGLPTPTYQWNKNGIPIAGAKDASLTLNGVQPADGGSYTVTATNSLGTATSAAATLTVWDHNGPFMTEEFPTPPYLETFFNYSSGDLVSIDFYFYVKNIGTSGTISVNINGEKRQFTVDGDASYILKSTVAAGINRLVTYHDDRVVTAAFPGSKVAQKISAPHHVILYGQPSSILMPVGGPVPVAATVTAQPSSQTVNAGSPATFTVQAAGTAPFTYQWTKNGSIVTGAASASWTVNSTQPTDTGIYAVTVGGNGGSATSSAVICSLTTTNKVLGTGQELQPVDIRHPNGNIFDQVLMTGSAEAITADPGQITRTSYIDLDDDIVQVEFSGPGTLALVLDAASGPALPTNYKQDVHYMKGHAGIVIAGATENTNVTVLSVGRATANDPTGAFNLMQPISAANDPARNGSPLFQGHGSTNYDGVADIAYIAISSANGKFGGVRTANANYFAAKGLTGIYAPNVQFTGPIFIGDIIASDDARPVIILGSVSDARVTGGDMLQSNGQAVQVSGLTQLKFTAGSDSHGRPLAAQSNRAVFRQDGVDVTAGIVVNP